MQSHEQEGSQIKIRPCTYGDRSWVFNTVCDLLGGVPVITPSGIYDPADLPGFIAIREECSVGLLNYVISQGECEIITLASSQPRCGIGTRLVDEITQLAKKQGCKRLWLVTNNDNLNALRFYQKRGFRLSTIHRNAMDDIRRIKPNVPQTGLDGIPLRVIIEMEMDLTS